MESAIVGRKGQVVIPQKIRAMLQIKRGTRVHPPSPEAPPLGGEEGEARVASERAASPRLRSRRFEARSAEKGFRPTGAQEGATGLPVGLHFEARHGEIVLTPLASRYFERMAGCLGTGGKALKVLLAEKKQEARTGLGWQGRSVLRLTCVEDCY